MSDFNTRFEKTWKRIPMIARPLKAMEFMIYLKSLNSTITILIKSMGVDTLPNAYDLSMCAKNSLIEIEKLPPLPSMPMFVEISGEPQEEAISSGFAP